MPDPDAAQTLQVVVVIPTYQNAPTVVGIVERVLAAGWRCIVVDDGSTDGTARGLVELRAHHPDNELEVVHHESNRGKAAALLTGFDRARELGASHVITLDADGQHDPGQIADLWRSAQQCPDALVLGERPTNVEGGTPWRSMLGRRVTNALTRAQCGITVRDSQTGFRVYPIVLLDRLSCRFSRYAFETEVIIRAGRVGLPVRGVPIRSRYFPKDERVSHFKPIRDSLHSLVMQAALLADRWVLARLGHNWLSRQVLLLPLIAFMVTGSLRQGMTPEAQWHPALYIGAGAGLITLMLWRVLRLGIQPVYAATLLFLFVGAIGALSEGTWFYSAIHSSYFTLKEVMLHLWVGVVCAGVALARPAWLLGAQRMTSERARWYAYALAACSVVAVPMGLALQSFSGLLAGGVPFVTVLVVQGLVRGKTRKMTSNLPAPEPDPSVLSHVEGGNPLLSDARLNRYFKSEADRPERTRELFDQGASGYDKAEWLTGLGFGPWYRRLVLKRLGLAPGMSVLDVAIGTGLVAVEAHKLIQPGGELVGLDPSPGMLAHAKRKLDIETIEGIAESIPLEGDRFDVVTMGYALRHVASLDRAFCEYLRVLKPGGRVCVMEISRPNSGFARAVALIYIRYVIPLLARLTGEKKGVGELWRYYWDTIDTCIDSDQIMEAMRRAGFEAVRCDRTYSIFREYLGTKPE